MNPFDSDNQLLITGHPFVGGEEYLADIFTKYDYNIKIGEWGQNGIVSWELAVDPKDLEPLKASYPPSGVARPSAIDNSHIVHYISDPIYAIPNIMNLDTDDSYNYRKRILHAKYQINLDDYSPIDRVAKSLMLWSKLIDEQQPGISLRIEDSVAPVLEYTRQKFGWSFENNDINTKYIKKQDSNIKWDKLNPIILKELDDWCFEYGYIELSKRIPTVAIVSNQNNAALQPILGPRSRFVKPATIQVNRSTVVSMEEPAAPNIRPRVVHNVVVQTQKGVEAKPRVRQRARFGVRKRI